MQRLQSGLIKLFIRFFALFPLSLLQSIGAFSGRLAWQLNSDMAKYTRLNLKACYPEMNEQGRDELGKKSLQETFKMMFEVGKAWIQPVEATIESIKSFRDEAGVEQILSQGKGVVIIAPHLGNWEVLNIYLSQKYQLHVLYQPPNIEGLEEFISQGRAKTGTFVHPTNRRGVMAIFDVLRKGGVVGILPDQEPPSEGGLMAPFFGNEALTMTLVSKLIQKTGARAVCGYARRLEKGKGYEVVIMPANQDIYSEDLDVSVTALNKTVEESIREAPEQYQWEYKRFRQGPEGKTRFYKDS